jgi:hypothetical protein
MITSENIKTDLKSYCPKHNTECNVHQCLGNYHYACEYLRSHNWFGGSAYYCKHKHFRPKYLL